MKREQWLSCLAAACLAFALAFGSAGCLVTGFGLDADLKGLALACALFAAASALCFSFKRGGLVIACLLALTGGYLWQRGTLVSSFSTLLHDITVRFDSAYGWGIFGSVLGTTDTAVRTVGCLIAICTGGTVCRRKTAIPAVTVALLPLLVCLVVTDTVPAEGCIFLLAMGLIVLMLTNNLRRVAPAQANTLAAMVALPVAAALGLLFLVAPQEGYVNQSQQFQDKILTWIQDLPQMVEDLSQDVASAVEGTVQQESVDLENQGPRNLYTYPVMDVIAPQTGTLYLRERDYDSYDGTGWTATARRSEEFGLTGDVEWESRGVVTISTRRSRSQLFYPYYPGDTVTLTGGAVDNGEEITVYEVLQYALPTGWQQTLAAGEGSALVVAGASSSAVTGQRYKSLPTATQKWASALLEDILTDEDTATEMAQTIAAYVKNSASYDLNTEKMPASADDFAIWFLEKSDTGYCVHFATATAVLLRAAGVRSRYVTGYMTYGVKDQKVTVTADQAHAWVEYYEPLLGVWIPLESTPGGSLPQTGSTEATGETESVTQTEPELEQTTEGGPPAESEAPGEETGPSGIDREETPRKREWDLGFLWWIFVPAAAVAAIAAQRAARLSLRKRRMTRGRANARALALWREASLYARLLRQPVPRPLERLAQKAKYSQHTLTQPELAEFEKYLRAARSQCRAEPWYRQLLYRWVFALY